MKQVHTSKQMSKVFRGLVLALALVLVACGGDSDEATPTATSDSGQVAVPTSPPVESTPAADVSEDEITVLEPEQPATAEAATAEIVEVQAEDPESTPEEAVDLATADAVIEEPETSAASTPEMAETEETDIASTPVEEIIATPPAGESEIDEEDDVVADDATPDSEAADVDTDAEGEEVAPTERARTGNETFDHPGDGTGGSGMPAEPDSNVEEEEDSAAATPSASPVAQLSISGCEVPDVPGFLGDNPNVILTADVNFRSGPGVDCDALLDEPLGEGQTVVIVGGPVTQTDDDTEWVQVEFNGEPGWITTEFIEPVD